jgi:glycosyltransferase involved in cell wall biosynthesis
MNRTEPPPILARFGADDEKPAMLVINQCTEIDPPPELARDGLRMHSMRERGVSLSRNRALASARGEILAMVDHDLEYFPASLDTIRRAYRALPDADIITFQFLNRDTGQPVKPYPGRSFRHGLRSIGSVSLVEMTLRRERVGQLTFDTRFGPGAPLQSGEENIFMADALRAGLRAYYWPEPICDHPGVGTGYRMWDRDTAYAKGATFRRMYPLAWPAVAGYFALIKHQHYGAQLSLPHWLFINAQGALKAGGRST